MKTPLLLTLFFYGSTDCKNLPFGQGDERFGCPTNGPGWQRLDQIFAFGANNWTAQEFTVTPTSDIYAIAIGPDCHETQHTANPYYFLDNLVLADVKEFGLVISPENHPCDPDFKLSLPFRESTKYQWYLDGVAMVGEISNSVHAKKEGSYQVLVQEEGYSTCKVTKPYIHSKPEIRTTLEHNL